MRPLISFLLPLAVALPTAPTTSLDVDPTIIDFAAIGAVKDDMSLATCRSNAALFNRTFNGLSPGQTFLIPNATFCLMGGIQVSNIQQVSFQIDGTLRFWSPNELLTDLAEWPHSASGDVAECLSFENIQNIKFTSSGKGVIDGQGYNWWGAIKYLLRSENRPRLFVVHRSKELLVENIIFKDSPYWTTLFNDISDLVIRFCDVSVHVLDGDRTHSPIELTAFNTDGFDVAGRNVHIHDCNIWNDDDCIAVKEVDGNGVMATCSENMLFERINASGVGLTIGSIGSSDAHICVRNITFRDVIMPNTFKGIYVKSRPDDSGTGEITNILFENITIENATQWPIWIGPQQAIYSDACSLLWPFEPNTKCPVPVRVTISDIVLRNVRILNPTLSPGVLWGNGSNPITGLVFDNVVVTNPGPKPWGDHYYACENVQGIAKGGTWPVPPCFQTEP